MQGAKVKFEVKPLVTVGESLHFVEHFHDVLASISGLTDSKIQSYFVAKAIGSRSKSLASTIRALMLNDLQLKGWVIHWSPFKGSTGYESAIWNFDAAKKVEINGEIGWLTLEISFDNRAAVGTHMVKSRVANNMKYRKDYAEGQIIHHCLVAASKSFKDASGLDNSVATAEEFESAADAYSVLDLTEITMISLEALETIEVTQRKTDGRTKSKLLNIDFT